MKKIHSLAEFSRFQKTWSARKNGDPTVVVSSGTCGHARGSEDVIIAFEKVLSRRGKRPQFDFKVTGCHGFCEVEPIVRIEPRGIFYQRVTPADVEEIISETIGEGKIVDRLLFRDPVTGEKYLHGKDIPFYRKQKLLISGNNMRIDPAQIEDYLALGGYAALAKVLKEVKPERLIDEVKKAGLRGRGGGGFFAWKKWESCRNAHGKIKYVICNADEGDPGAYMDRSLLEGNPHSILEGMIIGAYAIGVSEGYIYVRREYPLAIQNVETAIEQARKLGLLGRDILGTGFSFDVKIAIGGGAFVCGESTALMSSIEGKRGEPRAKYVHTVEKGLWNRPSNLNNVETWANIPLIINKGAKWYSRIGTAGSKGTKIFSLVGKIQNTGLVEVPMGITLREIIFDIGGGIPDGKKFKAVQTGGPSGGCLPESLLDLPVDFDRLSEVGSMMGSGGMIVMDETTCMVDLAKYFLNFLLDESCGMCFPCREGLDQLLTIVSAITVGKGKPEDLQLLQEIGGMMKDASLCALGRTAPNPLLSTMRYFQDEYEAHILKKKCPAGVCKALICYEIWKDKCAGCGACAKLCPEKAISGAKNRPHEIDPAKCIKCGICKDTCKYGAIQVS
jgi:NADH-quinone oxidoreductase subunit F